jgi:hypothetical protein
MTDDILAGRMEDAIDHLAAMVEPLCGFRPESTAQAISLLATRFLEMVPAMEALAALAVEMDVAESEKA